MPRSYFLLNTDRLLSPPFQACVIPRPIGWISTINPDAANGNGANGASIGAANLAPFSQFNNLTFDPPCESCQISGFHISLLRPPSS